jgi:AcrR family transcriptional regulator
MKTTRTMSVDIYDKEQRKAPKQRGNRTTRIPEILEVAIRVFVLEGNTGLTLRRVAAVAGVRLSTLQHYFGTKDSLILSIVEEMSKKHLERFHALADDTRTFSITWGKRRASVRRWPPPPNKNRPTPFL